MSAPERRVAASAAITSVATAATMLSGGIFALLIAARFGSTAETDGFFAAYGVYTVVVLVAQSTRTTIVGRLVQARFSGFDAFVAGIGVLTAVTGIVFVGLGGALGGLLTAGLASPARDTAAEALLILWPAAALQLLAALAAAMLGVLDNFTRAAIAYGAGSVGSILAFLALSPVLGIEATPVAVLIGSLITAAPLLAGVRRAGWRPGRAAGAARHAGLVLLGAGPVALAQALYLITAAIAARGGEGLLTTYSYGYFAHQLLLALVASSLSIVLAAPIAESWDRRPASLRPHIEAVMRAGLLVLVPLVATGALLGDEVAGALLTKFDDAQINALVEVFVALAPAVVFAQALAVPLVALYALGRYAAATMVGIPVLALHAALSLGVVDTGDLTGLALMSSLSSMLFSAALAALLYRKATGAFLAQAGREAGLVLVPAGAAFAGAWAALHEVGDLAVLAAGCLLFGAAVAVLLPGHRAVAVRLVNALAR